MTHDEIKKLDERELYEKIAEFVYRQHTLSSLSAVADDCWEDEGSALALCYQAEEKLINVLGKGEEWAIILAELVGFRPHEFTCLKTEFWLIK